MEKVSLFNFLFSVIPRSMVAVYFCKSLLDFPMSKGRFLVSSLIFACFQWLVRAYLPFGYHSFIACLFLALLLWHYSKISLSYTFSMAIIYFILLYIFDFFVVYIYNMFTNFAITDIWALELTRVILTIPASVAYITIALFYKRQNGLRFR